ncbi:prepilin-type N-terminal cleavage/methylation domain-containing protein [Candidatus Poribacteria bacterium]|nr:prepilin-type N-terminal cleavage/methylation domain-containing protein [Candidatus Poribacteria bacterium]
MSASLGWIRRICGVNPPPPPFAKGGKSGWAFDNGGQGGCHFDKGGRGGPAGFTLIEVVVATAILAVIFSIVFGSFFYTINNAEEQEERASIYHRANFILNNISENISSAYVPLSTLKSESQESENATVLTQPAEEEETQPVFAGKDASDKEADTDSLSAFTTNPRFGESAKGGGFAYIKYEVVSAEEAGEDEFPGDENNPFFLRCSVESPFFSKETEELDEETRTWDWELSVRSFSVEYSDGSDWLNEWSYEEKKALPRAIKVEIELADSSGASYPFSTIAPVHVNTVLEEPSEETGEEGDETEQTQEEAGTESNQTGATSTSTGAQTGSSAKDTDLFAQ